jgi:hypothetical protein
MQVVLTGLMDKSFASKLQEPRVTRCITGCTEQLAQFLRDQTAHPRSFAKVCALLGLLASWREAVARVRAHGNTPDSFEWFVHFKYFLLADEPPAAVRRTSATNHTQPSQSQQLLAAVGPDGRKRRSPDPQVEIRVGGNAFLFGMEYSGHSQFPFFATSGHRAFLPIVQALGACQSVLVSATAEANLHLGEQAAINPNMHFAVEGPCAPSLIHSISLCLGIRVETYEALRSSSSDDLLAFMDGCWLAKRWPLLLNANRLPHSVAASIATALVQIGAGIRQKRARMEILGVTRELHPNTIAFVSFVGHASMKVWHEASCIFRSVRYVTPSCEAVAATMFTAYGFSASVQLSQWLLRLAEELRTQFPGNAAALNRFTFLHSVLNSAASLRQSQLHIEHVASKAAGKGSPSSLPARDATLLSQSVVQVLSALLRHVQPTGASDEIVRSVTQRMLQGIETDFGPAQGAVATLSVAPAADDEQLLARLVSDEFVSLGLNSTPAMVQVATALFHLLQSRQHVIVCGSLATGKTSVIRAIQNAMTRIYDPHDPSFSKLRLQPINSWFSKTYDIAPLFTSGSSVTAMESVVLESVLLDAVDYFETFDEHSLLQLNLDGSPSESFILATRKAVRERVLSPEGRRLGPVCITYEVCDMSRFSPITCLDLVCMPTDDSISWPAIFESLVESLAELHYDVDKLGQSTKPTLTHCSGIFEPALQFVEDLMGARRLLPDVAVMQNFVSIFKALAVAIRSEEEELVDAESENGPAAWHPSFDTVLVTFTYAFIWAFGGGIDEAKHGKFHAWLQEPVVKGRLMLPPDVSDAFNLVVSKDKLVRVEAVASCVPVRERAAFHSSRRYICKPSISAMQRL